jgi:hypothetical protein
MYRNNFTRKLFKTKNKKRKTKIRKQKTKIRKQKTKIMRGGAQDAQSIKYIDYLINVMNKSSSSLYTLSVKLDEDITEGITEGITEDILDNIHLVARINDKSSVTFKTTFYEPLRSEIERITKDDLYTANYTLFSPIRKLAHNYIFFLTIDLPAIRVLKKSKFDRKLDEDIVEIIKAISEILFSIDSIIYINKPITDTSYHREKYIKDLMTNVHNEYKAQRFGYSNFLVTTKLFASNITEAYTNLEKQIVTGERDYDSINKSATALLHVMSNEIVNMRQQQQDDDRTPLTDVFDLATNIPKDMYYLINIINISKMITEMITKENEELAAATMSKAATRVQAQQRGKSTRKNYDAKFKIVADEIELRAKAEQQAKKELDEAKKELEDLLK